MALVLLLLIVLLLAAAILFLVQAAKNKNTPQSQLAADEALMEEWADTIAAKVGIKLKLGQTATPTQAPNPMSAAASQKAATPPAKTST